MKQKTDTINGSADILARQWERGRLARIFASLSPAFRRAALILLLAVMTTTTTKAENLTSGIDYCGTSVGCIFLSGWVFDPGAKHWELGNQMTIKIEVGTHPDNQDDNFQGIYDDADEYLERDDINSQYHISGKHGFRARVEGIGPMLFEEETEKTLYVNIYAIANFGNGQEEILLNKTPYVLNVRNDLAYDANEDIYYLCNADDWNDVAIAMQDDRCNGVVGNFFSSCNYKLYENFDNSTPVTKMFGKSTRPFTGTFDGNGQTLNVQLSGTEHVAPFAYTDGVTIQNLTVAGTINATQSAGGIVGYAANTLTIENCVSGATISGFSQFAGGLLGWCDDLTLTMGDCLFKGAFSPADGGKYHLFACKNASKTVTMSSANGLYYVNTLAPSEGLGKNCIAKTEGTPVSATLVKGVWDDPFVAADGQTYYRIHVKGSEENPHLIYDADHWNNIAEAIADDRFSQYFSDRSYRLADNFDNTTAVTRMFGTTTHPFTGTFDGNGQTLNVQLSGTEHVAPFAYTDGVTIRNLTVTGTISATQSAGGIVGYAANSLTLKSCACGATISGFCQFAGGLLGWCDDLTLNIGNCLFKGAFSPANGGKYQPIACKDTSKTVTVPPVFDLYYLNTVAPSEGLGDNCIPRAKGTPVSATLDDGVWDDPFVAADGITYYGVHFNGKHLPYEYGFETPLDEDGWTRVDCTKYTNIEKVTNSHGGNYGFCFMEPNDQRFQYLISPEFDGHTGITVRFYYEKSPYLLESATFQVGYSTTTPDIDAFNWDNGTTASIIQWLLYEGSFPKGTKYIGIKFHPNYHGNLDLDDFSFTVCGVPSPTHLNAIDITEYTASPTWEAPEADKTITGYTYQYKKTNEADWSAEATVDATSVTLTGLTANTDYQFRVKALYGEDESVYVSVNFTTAMELPYDYGFENGMNRWSRVDDEWGHTGISEKAKHDGEKGYMFSWSTTSSPQYLISPRFAGNGELAVSFFYRTENTYNNETFYVGYSTSTNDVDAFIWGDEISVKCDQYLVPEGDDVWVSIPIESWSLYENVFPAGTRFIAIKYTSNFRSLFLDDFFVVAANVGPKPKDLAVKNCTGQTTTLTWTAPQTSNGITGYAYQYKKASDAAWSAEVTTTATTVTISGMTAGTDYEFRVKTLYGSDASLYSRLNFTTAMELPYDYGFENGMNRWTGMDEEWRRETGISEDAKHEGEKGYCFIANHDNQSPQYLFSPRLSDNSELAVLFYYRSESIISHETFHVGYSTTTNDIDAFYWGDEISVICDYYNVPLGNDVYQAIPIVSWSLYENVFPAGTKYIAVKYTSNKTSLLLDDFTFLEYVGPKPDDLAVQNCTDQTTTLTWTAPQTSNDITGYAYQYKKASDAAWSAEVTTTATTATISGMTAGTDYEFRVKTLYGSNASLYSTLNFTSAVALPYSYGFEDGLGGWTEKDCYTVIKDIIYTEQYTGICSEIHHSGDHAFAFCPWTDDTQYLISPRLSDDSPIMFSFSYRNGVSENGHNYLANFQVGGSQTTSDISAFTWSTVVTSSKNWKNAISLLPVGTKYIAIKWLPNTYYLYLDDFRIREYVKINLADQKDNTTTITTNMGEDAIVTLQDRILHRNGYWQTLCLPFSLESFSGTPLAGATVKTLGSTSFSNGTLTLNFEDATSIEAGKPYIVNWTDAAYLTINSTEDWDAFAESVNSGKSYAGKTVMLGADINVSTMVGTAEHPFDGIIEGNHKRLTIDISNGGNGAAPFRYIKDATIKNVRTIGSVSGGNYSAGLVGFASGTNTIHNCLVETDVDVSTYGGEYVGGILGNGTSSTTTIRDCMYNGDLHGLNFGMIYGWGEAGGTHTIENCMSSGYCYLQDGSVADLMLVAPGGTCNVINCYKYQEVGTQDTYWPYSGGDESEIAGKLGDQWTTNAIGGLAIQLSEIITVAYTNLVNPEFIGFNISDATANVSTDYADFLGSCSPFASTEGLLFDEYNPNNGACRGALRLANLNDAAFDGWYTDAELTTPVTTIPFAADGTVTLYTKATKPLVKGDVNGDGKVTPADAIMILYHYFGVAQNGFNEAAADLNGDSHITPADAIEALYKYFGSSSNNARRARPATTDEPMMVE